MNLEYLYFCQEFLLGPMVLSKFFCQRDNEVLVFIVVIVLESPMASKKIFAARTKHYRHWRRVRRCTSGDGGGRGRGRGKRFGHFVRKTLSTATGACFIFCGKQCPFRSLVFCTSLCFLEEKTRPLFYIYLSIRFHSTSNYIVMAHEDF